MLRFIDKNKIGLKYHWNKGFNSTLKRSSCPECVCGSVFQRRGEALVNARSSVVTSLILGTSGGKSSLAGLVRHITVRNVTSSVRYIGARLLVHL